MYRCARMRSCVYGPTVVHVRQGVYIRDINVTRLIAAVLNGAPRQTAVKKFTTLKNVANLISRSIGAERSRGAIAAPS